MASHENTTADIDWQSTACAFGDDGLLIDEEACADWIEQILDAFVESPEANELPFEQESNGELLHDLAVGYRRKTLQTLEPDDVRHILTVLFPSKVPMAPKEAGNVIVELRAFFSFLERALGAENAAACRAVLTDELREEMVEGLR